MQLPLFTSAAMPATPGAQALAELAGASKAGSPATGLAGLIGQTSDADLIGDGGDVAAAFAEALAGVLQLQIQLPAQGAPSTQPQASDTPPSAPGTRPAAPTAALLQQMAHGVSLPLADAAVPADPAVAAEAVPAIPPGQVKEAFKDLRGKPAAPGLSSPPDDALLAPGPKALPTPPKAAAAFPLGPANAAPAEPVMTEIAPVPPQTPAAAAAMTKASPEGQPSSQTARSGDKDSARAWAQPIAATTGANAANGTSQAAAPTSEGENASEPQVALAAADTAPDAAADAPDAPVRSEPPTPALPPLAAAGASQSMPKAVPATFVHLASQIVQKLSAKVTRFDLELLPAGLGRVDVKVEISPSGQLTAALNFDNPHAAAELKTRADELRTALQQAGFDLKDGSLSFDFNGQQQRWAQEREEDARAFAGKAFAAAADKADDLLASVAEAAARLERRVAAGGLDLRI